MIKPEMLWNFIKTCEDTGKVGRVCRTLGRQTVADITPDELLLVQMIDNDSKWLDERHEEKLKKDRERKRFAAAKRSIPKESTESAHSNRIYGIRPLPTSLPTSLPDNTCVLSNTPYKPPKGGDGVLECLFDRFWSAYPRKCAKQAAKRKFETIFRKTKEERRPGLLEAMLKALEGQRRSDQWLKDDGQFIPHPTTWLNQARWEDEVAVSQEAQEAMEREEKAERERQTALEARKRVLGITSQLDDGGSACRR